MCIDKKKKILKKKNNSQYTNIQEGLYAIIKWDLCKIVSTYKNQFM
jgi:hypothetical protein